MPSFCTVLTSMLKEKILVIFYLDGLGKSLRKCKIPIKLVLSVQAINVVFEVKISVQMKYLIETYRNMYNIIEKTSKVQ